MSGSAHSSSPYDCAPESALSVVPRHEGTLFLDLDETAYLRNSTEDFLDCARPGLVALLVLRALDFLKPWHISGGVETRDVWRVRIVSLLMPWIWISWRRRVKQFGPAYVNRPLIEAARARSAPTMIITLGFRPVVTPLVAAMGLADLPLIATRLNTFSDRRRGKLALVEAAIDPAVLAASAVVTDSPQDIPLLARCGRPMLTVWPAARYRKALSGVYLPGQYLSLVKRPGQRYIFRGILQEDFAFWVLASIGHLATVFPGFLGLAVLLVSFWAIYERGYVDNDIIGERYESAPKLSEAYGRVEVATPMVLPWVWAIVTGLIAIFLLRWPGEIEVHDLTNWGAVLVGTHVLFKVYNRIDKTSRIWLFPGLQFARTAAFVALVPIGLAASLALSANVLARWVPYYLYRVVGKDWPDAPFFLSRLLFYVLLWLIVAMTHETMILITWPAIALLLWNVFRARKELVAMIRGIHRIDRAGPPAA